MIDVLENPLIPRQAGPLTIAQYHELIDRGAVDSSELIRGALVGKMSKSPLHTAITARLLRHLTLSLPDCWVRKEDPLTFTDSEPEPDISVVPGRIEDFPDGHPKTARLVVEVSISSAHLDREKGVLYAEAGVEEFWLVLPEEKAVEVHTAPREGTWTNIHRYRAGESFASLVFPALTLRLDELFTI